MITELWIIFLLIVTIFLYFGYNQKAPILVMLGWIVLHLLSWDFEINGLTYVNGINQTVSGSSVIAYDLTASFTSHVIGFILILITAFAFVSVFFSNKLWRE